MGDVLVVEVHIIRSGVVGFENGEVFAVQVIIPLASLVNREQKRQIGVVGIQHLLFAEIEGIIAGHGREEGIQEVVALFIEQRIDEALGN